VPPAESAWGSITPTFAGVLGGSFDALAGVSLLVGRDFYSATYQAELRCGPDQACPDGYVCAGTQGSFCIRGQLAATRATTSKTQAYRGEERRSSGPKCALTTFGSSVRTAACPGWATTSQATRARSLAPGSTARGLASTTRGRLSLYRPPDAQCTRYCDFSFDCNFDETCATICTNDGRRRRVHPAGGH
jgi:hypothetical protein